MDGLGTFLALAVGLFLRLALPLAVTLFFISFLRRLDSRWQLEAEQMAAGNPAAELKCWEMKNCTPEQREACLAVDAGQPCWQERRLKNGYLREECLSCEVFEQAPLPLHPSPVIPR
jgi:hypothetical protein